MKETRGVTSGSEGRRPPLFFFSQSFTKTKTNLHTLVQKDALTISCMVSFFCPYISSSRRTGRWPQRDDGDVCGRKVRFDVVASVFAFKGGKVKKRLTE